MAFCSSTKPGISALHGPHHVAQKFNRMTLPLYFESETSLSSRSLTTKSSFAGFASAMHAPPSPCSSLAATASGSCDAMGAIAPAANGLGLYLVLPDERHADGQQGDEGRDHRRERGFSSWADPCGYCASSPEVTPPTGQVSGGAAAHVYGVERVEVTGPRATYFGVAVSRCRKVAMRSNSASSVPPLTSAYTWPFAFQIRST